MAAKNGKANGAGKSKRRGAKAKGEPGIGHNFKVDRKQAKAFVDRLDALHDAKASKNGEFMTDIKAVYEEAANEIGVPRKIVREIYAEHSYERKRQKHEADREPDEQDQADKLRLALGSFASSPLGKAAVERKERAAAAKEMEEAGSQA